MGTHTYVTSLQRFVENDFSKKNVVYPLLRANRRPMITVVVGLSVVVPVIE